MAPRRLGHEAAATATTASDPNHFSVGTGLIDEDELARIKAWLIGFPLQTRFSDVGPILFGGAQRFF
jgi:hypothetical protein